MCKNCKYTGEWGSKVMGLFHTGIVACTFFMSVYFCRGNRSAIEFFALILVNYPSPEMISVCDIYVSQFTEGTYCFADGRCLFKQPQSVIYHWNQYDEEISKKYVRPSVRL